MLEQEAAQMRRLRKRGGKSAAMRTFFSPSSRAVRLRGGKSMGKPTLHKYRTMGSERHRCFRQKRRSIENYEATTRSSLQPGKKQAKSSLAVSHCQRNSSTKKSHPTESGRGIVHN